VTYNIYLANPYRSSYRWQQLCFAVQALFSRVVVNHSWFTGVRVKSTADLPNVSPFELLIYVLESPDRALVGPNFGNTFGGPNVGGMTGWDSSSPIVGSEVYIQGRNPRQVADLIFHEALHNKLRWTDSQLHSHPSQGLAASPIQPPLNAGNIQLMMPALSATRPQWLGGP
jgi:hypothetical protein